MSSEHNEMMPPQSSAPLQTLSHQSSGSRRSSMQPFPPLSPAAAAAAAADTGTNVPTRHPRPLTAAELHLELEKEQEAIVNRLTRELSTLRAHSASVASTTSTTSNAAPFVLDPLDPSSISQPLPLANGPTHPTAATRPGRSGSNVSTSHTAQIAAGAPPTSYPQHPTRPSSNSIQGTPRYDDVAQHKLEFEEVKRENERLRQRIIELEGLLRERRTNAATTAPTNGHTPDESTFGLSGNS